MYLCGSAMSLYCVFSFSGQIFHFSRLAIALSKATRKPPCFYTDFTCAEKSNWLRPFPWTFLLSRWGGSIQQPLIIGPSGHGHSSLWIWFSSYETAFFYLSIFSTYFGGCVVSGRQFLFPLQISTRRTWAVYSIQLCFDTNKEGRESRN